MKRAAAGRILNWYAETIGHNCRPIKPRHTRCCLRKLNYGVRKMSVWTPDNIIRSPVSDVAIPEVPFAEYMFSMCDKYKDKEALVDFASGRSYTYSAVKAASIKVASALTRLGYRKGDRIAVFSANIPEYTILMLATASIGIIVTPANPAYTAGELSIQLEHSSAQAVITILPLLPILREALALTPTLKDSIKEIFVLGEAEGCRSVASLLMDDGKAFPDVDIDPKKDLFVLPYSSGTTGLPKGVMLTHHNCLSNIIQVKELVQMGMGDTVLGILPFYHIYGMIPVQFGAFKEGCSIITLPKFDPIEFLKAIEKHKVSLLHIVPPIVLFLAKHPMVDQFDLSSLKYVISGAAPLGEGLTQQFTDRLKIPIYQGYGLTECSPVLNMDCPPGKLGSTGPIVPNTLGKIIDLDTGKNLGPGELGEYCAKGPQVMKGYLNDQEATDATIDKDGWLHTGDIGSFCEEGILTIEDRLKELIKYKGFQVPPAELEALLLTHPEIQDAAVIGIDDIEAGELPKAFIVPKSNTQITTDTVSKFVEERVSYYKRLRGGVEFIEEIPKSASGKILRRNLKQAA